MEKWEKIGFFSLVGHPRFTGRWCPSRCPRIFSQSVIVYILVLFVWTPAIYWSLVSQSQSRQNISISISSSQDPLFRKIWPNNRLASPLPFVFGALWGILDSPLIMDVVLLVGLQFFRQIHNFSSVDYFFAVDCVFAIDLVSKSVKCDQKEMVLSCKQSKKYDFNLKIMTETLETKDTVRKQQIGKRVNSLKI